MNLDNDLRRELISKSTISFSGLKKLNAGAGLFLLIQGIIMVGLGFLLTWKRDLYTFYLKFKIVSLVPPSFQVLPNPQVAYTLTHLGVILASVSIDLRYCTINYCFCKKQELR